MYSVRISIISLCEEGGVCMCVCILRHGSFQEKTLGKIL